MLCLLTLSFSLFAAKAYVFVSFSMPKQLLIATLSESARLKIPAYLNGMYQNSMSETAKKVMSLSSQVPGLSLQIDPTLFERFDIHQVPALVVEERGCFDVIYGNLSIEQGLARIKVHGECSMRGVL